MRDLIEQEKAEIASLFSCSDRKILKDLLNKINTLTGANINYLVELDTFDIAGSGRIIVDYINNFQSETLKAYLIRQLVFDRITNCDQVLLQLYLGFKASKEYISPQGVPAPAHIYARYDNAFRKVRSKKIANDLVSLVKNPRDAFYLPLTTLLLASWKIPEIKLILLSYADVQNNLGFSEDQDTIFPPYSFIRRQLRLIAIQGLKHYPSIEASEVVNSCVEEDDTDIKTAAQKVIQAWKQ